MLLQLLLLLLLLLLILQLWALPFWLSTFPYSPTLIIRLDRQE